jgi:hypothetical protein
LNNSKTASYPAELGNNNYNYSHTESKTIIASHSSDDGSVQHQSGGS